VNAAFTENNPELNRFHPASALSVAFHEGLSSLDGRCAGKGELGWCEDLSGAVIVPACWRGSDGRWP